MHHLRLTLARLTLALSGLLFAGTATAADRDVGERLDRMGTDLQDAEKRIGRLGREYGQRRGLIGAEDARQRYEDGVFSFLLGEFEPAALSFYTLVESEALDSEALHHDSQWYLAESVFELGNWATAVDAYGRIIEEGEEHPFFADAVRRQLEVYGIIGDTEAFYDTYRKWILSGRVKPTDAVKYTVAKSFYRQGDTARAKAMFGELPEGGGYHARARYFLGTILAAEGDLPAALEEFKRAAAVEGASQEVKELAQLALGRLHYELGNYDQAVAAYQTISSDSQYFADQLYELVWTYIKQEDWENALRHVEIFLIAYPDHAYTLRMKLNQGHLQMKAQAFEQALAAYENVVYEYTPLHDRLAELESSREDPAIFFERIVLSDEAFDTGTGSLPRYAVQMLVEEPAMGRVVGVSRELLRQDRDVEAAQLTIDEISGVLTSADEPIGTFGQGRQALLRVRDDALQLRHQMLQAEIDFLAANSAEVDKPEVETLQDQLAILATQAQDVQGVESARTDRYQVHEDQVRAVQEIALKLRRVVDDLTAEITATRRVLAEKRPDMSPADVSLVESEVLRAESELASVTSRLEQVNSDATRRQVMASVPRGRADDTDRQRSLLASDYDEMHRSLQRYRNGLTADPAPLQRIDQMWSRAAALDQQALVIRDQLEAAEGQELTILRDRLRTEIESVHTLVGGLKQTEGSAAQLAADITRTGFGRLEDQLYTTIMQADMGIVDVYWLRKTEVVDERTRLAAERGEKLQELDTRFNLIRQKLEE